MTGSRSNLRLSVGVLLVTAGAVAMSSLADVQVNTYTTNDQRAPAVAVDEDGDFVVVWASIGSSGKDQSSYSIQAQRYGSDGRAVGGEFQVNSYSTGAQKAPSVSMDAEGDFAVVWSSRGSMGADQDDDSIQGRLFASDGTPIGGEFQVNTYTTSWQRAPSVASDADGDFAVVWHSRGSFGSDALVDSIQARVYMSDGAPVGDQFQVNDYVTGLQAGADVEMESDGDFVVTWKSNGSGGDDLSFLSVQGQRYASDGTARGGQFQVNTFTTDPQTEPTVAMGPGGAFVVVWHSYGDSGGDGFGTSIQGQRYASDGLESGGEFQVNAYTPEHQCIPVADFDAAGNFLVVWRSYTSEGTDQDPETIQGRWFGSDGVPNGGQFQVNAYTTGNQDSPAVAVAGDGTYRVVWQSPGSDGSDQSGLSVAMFGSGLFADGFESGDTLGWSL